MSEPWPEFVPLWLGRVPYRDAFELQRRVHAARAAGAVPDVLLLLDHPPVITHSFTGRGSEHLLAPPELLAARGVALEPTDRGGDITFHGPGQLVGYPIVALREEAGERDLHRYLRRIEDLLVELARGFGVETAAIPGRTGTWLPDGSRKLAAIGVKAARWTTLHGFALNVATDLGFFELIVPCGIRDAGVTSLRELLGPRAPALDEVAGAAAACFARVFRRTPSPPGESLRILLPPSARPLAGGVHREERDVRGDPAAPPG